MHLDIHSSDAYTLLIAVDSSYDSTTPLRNRKAAEKDTMRNHGGH
jgi:hypothetical protein